jgi:hypothetical protein
VLISCPNKLRTLPATMLREARRSHVVPTAGRRRAISYGMVRNLTATCYIAAGLGATARRRAQPLLDHVCLYRDHRAPSAPQSLPRDSIQGTCGRPWPTATSARGGGTDQQGQHDSTDQTESALRTPNRHYVAILSAAASGVQSRLPVVSQTGGLAVADLQEQHLRSTKHQRPAGACP